jgi:DNA-binding NarL/FixJ family response regulator
MIKVLIADDHAIVRSGLKQILATTSDIQVVAEASNGNEAIEKTRNLKLDVLMLDMSMEGVSGVDLIRRIRGEHPDLPILILSMHNENQIVARAFRAGATAYIAKGSEPELLLAALRKVVQGQRYIDPTLVDALMLGGGQSDDRPLHTYLSDRELQVMQMIVEGLSLTEIADKLCLSSKTISSHKTRLMTKLGVESNAELFRYAAKHNLIQQ